MISGPHCAQPLKSTGAGDRFNAGYCLGLLARGTLADCLTLGCAASGFFVRQARSADRAELAAFLENWSAGRL
jgi:sugar/nucleoside kinase (ribokinase family)